MLTVPPSPRLIENSYSIRLVMLPSKKIRWRGKKMPLLAGTWLR